jgi:hypothetical protein
MIMALFLYFDRNVFGMGGQRLNKNFRPKSIGLGSRKDGIMAAGFGGLAR